LHLLGLIGGWPAAFVAQRALHHKTRKQPFQTIYWITVALHCGIVVWLCSPYGTAFLESAAR
jgi:uncharacterized membrane protein YsdA (DUF1294 family)